MMNIVFAPLLPFGIIAILAFISIIGIAIAWHRRMLGWGLRAAAMLVLLAALSGPELHQQDQTSLEDIVLVAIDQTASQTVGDRPEQTSAALSRIRNWVSGRDNTLLREVIVRDAKDDRGTALITAIQTALDQEPSRQIAGIFVISDGQVHDTARAGELPAPLHLLQTGARSDWDRRLIVRDAPGFAIVGQEIALSLLLENEGDAPPVDHLPLLLSINGEPAQEYPLPVGQEITLRLTLPNGGRNVLHFETPRQEGELTGRNNAAVVEINAVRDRLRVLLVSGAPHAGERTWRNLLKSDPSVDLVHFTILRPPSKQDGVPVEELSLIAFPTRELFLEKIDEFDLIIFDRYERRGILPQSYFENITRYIRDGGAMLVAAGAGFAGADSLAFSPLESVLPAVPSGRVYAQGFLPALSEIGLRHPVTAGLDADYPDGWGRWFRHVDLVGTQGDVLLQGVDARPLLMTRRVDAGRVALLGSDHAWLWDRGFEGGGPQRELLRRLAHWMMKEPELEEEALVLSATADGVAVERRSITDLGTPDLRLTDPSGAEHELTLTETEPGRFTAEFASDQEGLFRAQMTDGMQSVAARGPSAPREFRETLATDAILNPLIAQKLGGVALLEDGFPQIRTVREGRQAAGNGWLAITPRGAVLPGAARQNPLLPLWVWGLIASLLITFAWLREGRQD